MIKCSLCGAEILLVPNVRVMSEAIELHVEMHVQMSGSKETDEEAERIRDDLITQVLKKASRT